MAAYDLEEQEQLDELKTWWKMHGNLVTTLVTVAALVVVAWQAWNLWQRTQAAQASGLYAGVQEAMSRGDAKRSRELAGELIDKFSGTPYAAMAALLSAKAQTEGGDMRTAQVQLAWAVEHAKNDGIRDLARLRLAAILLDQKAYDDALKQLAVEPAAPLAARFGEMKGDILAAQGKSAEAASAYEAAIAKVDTVIKEGGSAAAVSTNYREVLQAKRDSLGGAQS
jgi:predicted negative regulator of RcsB-dependent stress response